MDYLETQYSGGQLENIFVLGGENYSNTDTLIFREVQIYLQIKLQARLRLLLNLSHQLFLIGKQVTVLHFVLKLLYKCSSTIYNNLGAYGGHWISDIQFSLSKWQ